MPDPIIVQQTELAAPNEATSRYIAASVADNTRRAYQSAWRHFASWCAARGVPALPAAPDTVAAYLAALADAGRRYATLNQRKAAIAQMHAACNLERPTDHVIVRQTMRGIRRAIGVRPKQHMAATKPVVLALVETITGTRAKDVRDRCLILLAFAGALRRSELVGLRRGDIHFVADRGVVITVAKSKTNQDGQLEQIAVPYALIPRQCAVRALEAWVAVRDAAGTGREEEPLFPAINRHGQLAATPMRPKGFVGVIKQAARVAGLTAADLAPHSLRAGFATSAVEAGVAEGAIMRHTRHKSVTTFRSYVRRATLWQDNAAARVL